MVNGKKVKESDGLAEVKAVVVLVMHSDISYNLYIV
jgi:hypothetical protein